MKISNMIFIVIHYESEKSEALIQVVYQGYRWYGVTISQILLVHCHVIT